MRLVRGDDELTGHPGAAAQEVFEELNEQRMHAPVDLVDEIHGPAGFPKVKGGYQI